eukprot:TRINITY_DN2063_c0_g1_i2.p1 TRINITY_DN2063_c0_g1~~TRINITY_DN2063_c0_g1_i2.p1  ORF type:complete len:227 (-),score=42.57 TRINITY_DN2063_c0_g1_i2:19-699(-)
MIGRRDVLLSAYHGRLDYLDEEVSKDKSLVHKKDCQGWTPLHLASCKGHHKIVSYLVANGADIHQRTDLKTTPLHLAAESGSLKTTELLLEYGSAIDAKDASGWTPLHFAAHEGRREIVRLLLQKGADRSVVDAKDRTPRRVAIRRNNLNTAHLFVSCHAKLEDMVCYFLFKRLADYGGMEALQTVLPESVLEKLMDLNEREKEIQEILVKREKSKSQNTYREHDR